MGEHPLANQLQIRSQIRRLGEGLVMRKMLLSGIAFAALTIAPAMAADMPSKAPAYLPPPAVYNWTGFYVGLNGGYSWGRTDVDYSQGAGALVLRQIRAVCLPRVTIFIRTVSSGAARLDTIFKQGISCMALRPTFSGATAMTRRRRYSTLSETGSP